MIHLPVYEPAGRDVVLSREDLLQHVLVLGATGSGKTCLMHRMLDQLIRHPEQPGLLVCYAKADDTVPRVRQMARQAGRPEVIVLGPSGTHYLDLFAPLRTLADVEGMVARLLLGSGSMGVENVFWDESRAALLDAALTLLLTVEGRVTFDRAMERLRRWLMRPAAGNRELATDLEVLSARQLEVTGREARKLAQAADTFDLWEHLDPRTRSNLQSCILNVLRPLFSTTASRCFEPERRPAFDPAQVATRGALCVVSVNALTEPALASLLLKVAKADFLRAVQSRTDAGARLCGLVMDEFPLATTKEDAETLATVRSRQCFVLAASQGLAALDERLGYRARQTLLTNFGTVIFLRSRERETGEFAALHMGTVEQRIRRRAMNPPAESWRPPPEIVLRRRFMVCPPGALGRLAPHQGYVALPQGHSPSTPLWFVPWFMATQKNVIANTIKPYSVAHTRAVMARARQSECTPVHVVNTLLGYNHAGIILLHQRALAEATEFFSTRCVIVPTGLDELPTPWLRALPRILWATRKPDWTHLPYMLTGVSFAEGILLVRFAQEGQPKSERITTWDRLRITLNRSLYPTVWRPPTRRYALKLRRHCPAYYFNPSL